MVVQLQPTEAHPDPVRCLVHAEPTAYANPESGPHIVRIAFDRIAISIFVTRSAGCDLPGASDLPPVTRAGQPADAAVQVCVASALLYDTLDKLQGPANPKDLNTHGTIWRRHNNKSC